MLFHQIIHNNTKRNTLIIIAISSSYENRLEFEFEIKGWNISGLLKPSLLKSSIATIENSCIITKVGCLTNKDIKTLEKMIEVMC